MATYNYYLVEDAFQNGQSCCESLTGEALAHSMRYLSMVRGMVWTPAENGVAFRTFHLVDVETVQGTIMVPLCGFHLMSIAKEDYDTMAQSTGATAISRGKDHTWSLESPSALTSGTWYS